MVDAAVDNRAFEAVHRADELGDERRRGRAVHLRGRAHLLDAAAVHDRNVVGDRQRLLLVVRDVERRDPELELDAPDLLAQLHAHLRIERRERLVEQQHARLDRERARERDALLHAAGELVRVAVARVAEPDELEQLPDALPPVGLVACRGSSGRTRRSGAPSCSGRASTPGRPCPCRACSGETLVTSLPSTTIRPSSGRSKPATSRSAVVLPQPDGPSSERNSPSPSCDLDPVERLHGAEVAVQVLQLEDMPSSAPPAITAPRAPRLRPTTSSESIAAQVMPKLSSVSAPGREALRLVHVLDEDREGVEAGEVRDRELAHDDRERQERRGERRRRGCSG